PTSRVARRVWLRARTLSANTHPRSLKARCFKSLRRATEPEGQLAGPLAGSVALELQHRVRFAPIIRIAVEREPCAAIRTNRIEIAKQSKPSVGMARAQCFDMAPPQRVGDIHAAFSDDVLAA